jgi:hypothetical protein
MRSWLRDTILPTIPETVRNKIVEVNKTYYNYITSSTLIQADTIWIPSYREMFGRTKYEDNGVNYITIFNSDTIRIKNYNNIVSIYWLRSTFSNETSFCAVNRFGQSDYFAGGSSYGVCVAFCTN